MASTPGRERLWAKVWKGASESPRPWKRMRMDVVASRGEGKCKAWGSELDRCSKSASVGILGGILACFLCASDGYGVSSVPKSM